MMEEKEYLRYLCNTYELPYIKVVAVTKENIRNNHYLMEIFNGHPERKGCFMNSTRYILDDLPDPKFFEILRHELRHYWQSIHYPQLFSWWSNHRHLYENINIRNTYDILEKDAQDFSKIKHGEYSTTSEIIENSPYKDINFLEQQLNNIG